MPPYSGIYSDIGKNPSRHILEFIPISVKSKPPYSGIYSDIGINPCRQILKVIPISIKIQTANVLNFFPTSPEI
jgi:hypothetical protein